MTFIIQMSNLISNINIIGNTNLNWQGPNDLEAQLSWNEEESMYRVASYTIHASY